MLKKLYLTYKRFAPQLQNNCARFYLARPAKKIANFPFRAFRTVEAMALWTFGLILGCQNNADSNRAHSSQTIIIGLIAGLVGKLLVPSKDYSEFVVTLSLSMVGAVIAIYTAIGLGCIMPMSRPVSSEPSPVRSSFCGFTD